jgi:hypothetical protein
MFEVWGAIERMGVVWAVIVTRVAGTEFGAAGGKHIASALRLLTGLQTLHLSGTRFSPMEFGFVYDNCLRLSREGVMFGVWGAVERMGVVLAVIVTRVADNEFGAVGGEHIASALRLLTGLQTLHLCSTRFLLLVLEFVFVVLFF